MNVRGLLRAAAVAAPWLVLHCGDANDLVIGRVEAPNAIRPDAGGGADAAPDANVDAPPPGGSGGSNAGAGGDGEGGSAAGSGGEGNIVDCEVGELPPAGSLLHRYDFSGPGQVAADSVGDADGDIIGPHEMDDDGVLTFTGDTDSYVNLPNGLVSSLIDATFVIWTTWNGGPAYQRIFDFGMSDQGENNRGGGQDFFALMQMPSTIAPDLGFIQLEIDAPGPGVNHLSTDMDLSEGVEHCFALSVRSGVEMDLYIDGELAGVLMTTALLADVDDRNNWFGRSNFAQDHAYDGTFNEVRIYSAPLSPCAVATLFEAGPSVLP